MRKWSSSWTRFRGVVGGFALVAGAVGGVVGGLSAASGAASAPTVSAVSPAAGPMAGGSVVALTGTGFTGATAVDFGSAAVPTSEFDVVSDTRIDVLTPAATSQGAVDVTVTTANGTSAPSSGDKFTYGPNSLPDCSGSMSSANNLCEEASGGSLTINVPASKLTIPLNNFGETGLGSVDLSTGSFDVPASAVQFPNEVGNINASLSADMTISPSQDLTGTMNLQTGAASTTANVDIGMYVPLLASAGFCVEQVSLTASGTISSYKTSSPGVVDASGDLSSSGPLTLTNPDGGGACSTVNGLLTGATQTTSLPLNAYVYAPTAPPSGLQPTALVSPTVTAVSPASGPTSGGSTVTVTGTGFASVSSGGTLTPAVSGVSVGSTALTASQYDVVSPTQLDIVTPAGSAGAADVTVANSMGTSATSPADQFTYLATPASCDDSSVNTTTSLCVDATGGSLTITTKGGMALDTTGFGMAALGTGSLATGDITIPASGLQFPQLTTQLLGTSIPLTLSGGSSLTGKFNLSSSPASASAAGTVDIGVYVPPLGTVCVLAQPLSLKGSLTTIGSGSVANTIQATGTMTDSGTVAATAVDGGNGCGVLEQLLNGATFSASIPFNVYLDTASAGPGKPSLSGISPASGSTSGGTTVTLTGSNLTGTTSVDFGPNQATNVTVVSDSEVTATAPAGVAGAVSVTVTTPGGSTTTGTPFTYVPVPTLTALSPSSGPTIGGTVVILTGTGLTGASGVSFGPAAASSFTAVSDTEVTATAPAHAQGSVSVTVTTADGTSNGEPYQYTVLPTHVTGITPSSGPAKGGNTVTLAGSGLTGATSVLFGATAATSFTVVGDTAISAVVPPGSGTVPVTVTGPGGTSAGVPYTYALPTLTAVSPPLGPEAGGNTVTLTGSDLTGASAVTFGSTPATNVTVVSDTEVTATAPPASLPGPVQVSVTTPDGTSNAEGYTYILPTLTGVGPASGPAAGGTTVTVRGKDLAGMTAVWFGTTAAKSFSGLTMVTGSEVQFTAVAPAGTGTVEITVITPDGTSNGVPYTYVPLPTLTAVSPAAGPAAGGTTVTLTGTGLTGATGVTFGSTAARSFTVVSDTEVTATAPAGTGTVQVTVTTPGGTSNGEAYIYQTCATPLTGISPAQGPQAGGDTVTLTGCGLSVVTAVDFGTNPATQVTVVSDTEVTAVAPAGSGTVQVTVTTAGGTSNGVSYTYTPGLPVVTGITPTTGAGCGGGPTNVDVTGTDLGSPTAVRFGSTPATIVSANAAGTEVTVTAPPGTGMVDVTVTTAAGTSAPTPADQFTYQVPPPVAQISPSSGPGKGGTVVTITVPCVDLSQAAGVLFGTEPAASYTVVDASTITAVSPAGSGPVDVTVVTPNGFSDLGPSDVFTYVSSTPPVVGAVAPGLGSSSGGTAVSIYGSGFTGATGVHFGSTAAPSFTVVDDNLITATAPPGSGEVHVTVTTASGTSATSAQDHFGYVPAPQVLFVLPGSAPANSGFHLVFLFGRGLAGATAVTFGSRPAPFLDLSSVVVMAFAPPEPAGTVDVRVTTGFGGTSAPVATDHFTYTGAPASS